MESANSAGYKVGLISGSILKKWDLGQGAVAHACNPSILGGQEFGTSLAKMEKLRLY